MTATPLRRPDVPPKRQFVQSNVTRLNVVVPGLGRIALHGVGSAIRARGYDGVFLPEGAVSALPGCIPLKCRIDSDFSIVWSLDQAVDRLGDPADIRAYPPDAISKMAELLVELDQRDETGLMSNVLGEALDEVKAFDRRVEALRNVQRAVLAMMKSPDSRRWTIQQAHDVRRRAADAQLGLERMERDDKPRVERLRSMAVEIRAWNQLPPTALKRPFMDVYNEAAGIEPSPSPSP